MWTAPSQAANPYVIKLSVLDDEIALNVRLVEWVWPVVSSTHFTGSGVCYINCALGLQQVCDGVSV